MSGCTDDESDDAAAHPPTMTNVPSASAKVWTLTKREGHLTIVCNNIVVLDWSTPESPPDEDACKQLGSTSFKVWFLKNKGWSTGNMAWAGADYELLQYGDMATHLGEAVLLCRVILPPGGVTYDTVGDNPKWTLLPSAQIVSTPAVSVEGFTAAFDKDTNKFSLTVKESPNFSTNWKCEFELSKGSGSKTAVSSTVTITVVAMTMSKPWILDATDLIVVCVLGNGAAAVSDVTFTWGETVYTSQTALAAGLKMVINAGNVAENTRTLTLDIPKSKVSTDMETAFKCSAKVDDDVTVEASGTAGVLAYIVQPVSSAAVETMEHQVNFSFFVV